MISEKAHKEEQDKVKRVVASFDDGTDLRGVLQEAIAGGETLDDATARIRNQYAKGIEALKEGSEGLMMLSGFGLLLFGGASVVISLSYGLAPVVLSIGGLLGILSMAGFALSVIRVREFNAKQKAFESRLDAEAESLRGPEENANA